eukprot:CAMPEP_0181312384 /NCGR_PEP_ID=MMETSP1101-20121128/13666_1 /TAXON_ID=46948 /ORGANISM="Rhodomonas abbreviata, Strain Caron Lab Isolate" /LENGTH=582 /DNA_ID=CAMNT_0023419227 /DNA_START=787 /DNA_END=2535 /DNA_ORIENTATION=+
MKGDYDAVLDAGLVLASTPADIVSQTNDKVDEIKVYGQDLLSEVNSEFSVLDEVKVLRNTLHKQLDSLKWEMLALQGYIEGCDSGTGACVVPQPTTAGLVLGSQFYLCGGADEHSANGVGAQMSDGRENPACNTPTGGDSKCPCCTTCHSIILDVESVQGQLPTEADIDDLNQELPVDDLSATIDEAMGDWDSSLRDFEEQLEPVDDGVVEAKKYVTANQIDGIAAGLFLLTWIILICVMCAMVLSMIKGALGDLGGICWWFAFILTVIYLICVVCPFFGIFTLVAVPMESMCAVIPAQGESAEHLFKLLEAQGDVDEQVKMLVNDCVLATNGYIWPAADLTKADIDEQLQAEFDLGDKIDKQDMADTFDIVGKTADFNQEDVNGLDSGEGSYGISLSCPPELAGLSAACGTYQQDMTTYSNDLKDRMDSVKAIASSVNDTINQLADLAASVNATINGLEERANKARGDMVSMIWDVGTCELIAGAYNGMREPLCDGVAAGVFGTWGALFIQAWFLLLLLFLINKASKIAFRHRHPDVKLGQDSAAIAPDPANEKPPPANDADNKENAPVPPADMQGGEPST